MRIYLLAFFVTALAAGYEFRQAVVLADEVDYRFVAATLSSGRIAAEAPPGAPAQPGQMPIPLRLSHSIYWQSQWITPYPLGWPLMLALPERWHFGWALNPLLGTGLLWLVGLIAQELFGAVALRPALWMTALSPYVLASSTGRASHALCAVLIAGACLLCLRGIRMQSLTALAAMFVLLVLSFHVRPLTAFVASVILGITVLWSVRGNRKLLFQSALLAGGAAAAAIVSFGFYNQALTGSTWRSPYTLLQGGLVPPQMSASASDILHNLATIWRYAAQSTLVYSFPFIFCLAAYGFRSRIASAPRLWIFAALFAGIVLAYLGQFESSGALFGERYWYEAYFAVIVLAVGGMLTLLERWPAQRSVLLASFWILTGVQLAISGATLRSMISYSRPSREIWKTAETYRNCECVVFTTLTQPRDPVTGEYLFDHLAMNLNVPQWRSASAFYLRDPGAADRPLWARLLGRKKWAVIQYDPAAHSAPGVMYSEEVSER